MARQNQTQRVAGALMLVALAATGACADFVLDDFASGSLKRWDQSDGRIARVAIESGGPDGKRCLAFTARGYVNWASLALPFSPPLDLRGKYLSVWMKQETPATIQFEFQCQPVPPSGYPTYFLHEVPDFVGSWQRVCLRLDARAILNGQPDHAEVTKLRISRSASGPQGTIYLADLRIVDTAPPQALALLHADVTRYTPRGRGAGPLVPPPAPMRTGRAASGREWTTGAPFIDFLNYEELLTPEYIARMAAQSPDVFHAGNLAPFKPYWGPSRDHSFAESPLASPDEVRRQIEDLKRFVARMKAAGVGRVLSSSCSITIGGSPTQRLGMWAFYDHWSDYLSFGLPPKPAHDPLTWNQKDASGRDHQQYGQPFTTWTSKNPEFDRYTPCPSNPEWLAYSRFVIRMIAESDFDGVFIDNNSIEGCCCDACRAGFAQWVRRRYTPGQARRLLGIAEPKQVDLRQVSAGRPMLQQEAADFWADQMREFLAECQAAGEAVHRGFFLCPNWTGGGLVWSRDHVWSRIPGAWPMRELDTPLGEGEPEALGEQPGYWGTVPYYKWDARMHTAGAGRTIMLNYQTQMANWTELAQAEAAAFGEGAVHCAIAADPASQATYARYRGFYREHANLFAPLESYAQVGVVCQRGAETSTMALGRMLLEEHVPFDFLDSRDLTPENVKRFPVLCCSGAWQVSDADLQALNRYVTGGGRLVIAGQFATMNGRFESRQRGPLFDLLRQHGPGPFTTACDKGWVAYTPLSLSEPAHEVLAALLRLAGVVPVVAPGNHHRGLRVNCYADADRIVAHLVNFRVPRTGEPVAQTDLRVQIPLPGKWRAGQVQATWYEPGVEPRALPVRTSGGSAEVVVPRLRVYGVVELRS